MARDFLVTHAGKPVTPWMYDRSEAEAVAQNAARRHPGRTYTVVKRVAAFQFPRNTCPAPSTD
jgi:hypothetical protein